MIITLANLPVDYFIKGGPIMWPILASFLLALAAVIDRAFFWLQYRGTLRMKAQEKARIAVGEGDFDLAWKATEKNNDPFLASLREGLANAHTSMLAAMQLRATQTIEKSEARLWVLSTMITLAPLLGLMGTVTGIMHSFSFIGDEQLAATKVSGGIAEALIATACGLAIAIMCLLPYNYYRRRVVQLRAHLERWINHTELLTESAKHHGHDIEAWSSSHRPAQG